MGLVSESVLRPGGRDAPPLLHRGFGFVLLVPQAIILLLLGMAAVLGQFRVGSHWSLLGFLPPAGVALSLLWWRWRLARLRSRVVAARGRLCLACGYDLRGSAPRGMCPECGVFHDAAHAAERWRICGVLPPQSS